MFRRFVSCSLLYSSPKMLNRQYRFNISNQDIQKDSNKLETINSKIHYNVKNNNIGILPKQNEKLFRKEDDDDERYSYFDHNDQIDDSYKDEEK